MKKTIRPIVRVLLYLILPAILVYLVVKSLVKKTTDNLQVSTATNPSTGNIAKVDDEEELDGNFEVLPAVETDEFASPQTLASKTNKLKKLAVQTLNNLDLAIFGTINTKMYSDNGYMRPKWGVWWDLPTNAPFDAVEKKPWELGFAGTNHRDITELGVEYIDGEVDETYPSFVSATPYQYRVHSQYGVNGVDILVEGSPAYVWTTGGNKELFDLGKGIGQSNQYGGGDSVIGVTKRAMIGVDVEVAMNGYEKHSAFMVGILSKTFGWVSSLYSGIFNTLGYIEDPGTGAKIYQNYPDTNGKYASDASINPDWKKSTKFSISGRDINDVTLSDFKNLLPTNEVAFYLEEFAPQGSHYTLNVGGDYVDVNKFGVNKTVRNPLAVLTTHLQWQSYYCYYKLGKHRNMMMSKLIADKGPFGKNPWSKSSTGAIIADSLVAHENQQIPRKYAFIFGLTTFMNAVDWWLWDREVLVNNNGGMDAYGGAVALIEMLDNMGAIDLHQELVPQFWNVEYSLDNGVTWKKDYAIDWDRSTTDVLGVEIRKTANKVLIAAYRPEGVEPLNFIVRTQIGTTMKYFKVTQDDWDTTSFAYKDTALNLIPNAHKHYYCQMFDV